MRTASRFEPESNRWRGLRIFHVALLLAAFAWLTSSSARASTGHWESLTLEEKEAVLAELQGLIKKDLENDEGESEADDPLIKPIMRQLALLDGPALAQAAGSLSAGDPVPMRDLLVAKAAAEGGEALKGWAEKKFEKDGVGRLLFNTLAGQTDGFKALLTALLDSRRSWCDVADVALNESRKAILDASRESAEELTKKTINWVIGEGPFAALGATPGDAYLMLLTLDAEYFQKLPRRLGAQAGGRFYDEYERARDSGLTPESAFEEIDPWMATSDGRWFVDLAGSMDGAQRALERCYQWTRANSPQPSLLRPAGRSSDIPSSSSVHILHCVDQQVDRKRQEGRGSLCAQTETAGAGTRNATAKKLVWLTDTLRRLTEARLAARGDETLAQSQQIAAQARARLDDLQRLRAEQARLCDNAALVAIVSSGTAAFTKLQKLSTRDIDVEIAIGRLAGCTRLNDSGEQVEAKARELATRVRQRVAEANTASTATCDWPDPTTVAAAEDNFRAAARAGDRLATASAAASRDLAELEALVTSVRNGTLGRPDAAELAQLRASRDAVTAALARDAGAQALADTCRAATASWAERKSHLGRIYIAMQGMIDEIRQLTSQARALLDAGKIAEDAQRIREDSDSCDFNVNTLTKTVTAYRETMLNGPLFGIHERQREALSALAGCSMLDSPPRVPLAAVEAELASAQAAAARLSAFKGAADMCVASAATKIDSLRRAAAEPPPADSDAGWTAVGGVQTIGSTTPATEGTASTQTAGPTEPLQSEIDALIQSAIDAYNDCQMGAALGLARRVQAIAPNHPWLAGNLGLITKRQQAQANTAAALSAARSAAAGGDLREAIAAANRAAADAPSCMSQTISSSLEQVRGQMAAARADQFERNREVFVKMVDSWVNAWTAAATTGISGPVAGATPSAAPRQVACSTRTEQGGDTPETLHVDVGNGRGTSTMRWDFYDIKDRIVVEYGGVSLLDTNCVGGRGTQQLQLSGFGGQVVVHVIPNCERKSTTQWEFTIECPR